MCNLAKKSERVYCTYNWNSLNQTVCKLIVSANSDRFKFSVLQFARNKGLNRTMNEIRLFAQDHSSFSWKFTIGRKKVSLHRVRSGRIVTQPQFMCVPRAPRRWRVKRLLVTPTPRALRKMSYWNAETRTLHCFKLKLVPAMSGAKLEK